MSQAASDLIKFRIFSALLLLQINLHSQCLPTAGTMPSTLTNNSAVGALAWSNLLNGVSSDNSYVSCGTLLGVLASAQTNYIQASGYGFSIPTTATVCGIEVKVERNAAGLLIGSSVTDKNVFLMKAGATTGTNHANGSGWTGSNAIAVYGNNADLWGTTWTPAQINASNFGVAFSAQMNAGLASLFLTANVDAISITVYYNSGSLPVELVSFEGEQQQQSIRLQWHTAQEKNNDYFELQKMNDDYSWRIIQKIRGQGNSGSIKTYTAYDTNPSPINYYRIRQTDYNQQSSTSQAISVEYHTALQQELELYPVPATDRLHVSYRGIIEKIEIMSCDGNICKSELSGAEHPEIDLGSLPGGLYLLKAYSKDKVHTRRFIKE